MHFFPQKTLLVAASLLLFSSWVRAAEVETNSAIFINPPSWLTSSKANRAIDPVQRFLEWDIRRVKVYSYSDQKAFEKFHGYDATVLAVTRKQDNSIHLGPRLSAENFESVFGHELVHVILYQKYKQSIPKWLEEGLCNFISKHGPVDYRWLNGQPSRKIRTLVHPFLDSPVSVVQGSTRYHYQASTAVVEMIANKCSLKDILQLSVGKNLENYLGTFCGLGDLDEEFKTWIQRKSK